MVRFSVKYLPTSLFSLKDSNATNSAAKSLLLPSPYSIKMAVINQAVTIGGDFDKLNEHGSLHFQFIRKAKISYYLVPNSAFCVNNAFVKILKQKEDKRSQKEKESGKTFEPGFGSTISFREYIYMTQPIEIIFEVYDESAMNYLKKYLHKINYFGKRGCFFQFLEYNDNPPQANVVRFSEAPKTLAGILQKYDDFGKSVTFNQVNNFSDKPTEREEEIWLLPLRSKSSSKSYTSYVLIYS